MSGRVAMVDLLAADGYIYVVNINPEDRPSVPNSNPRKWHEQIGVIAGALGATGLPLGVTGLAATPDPESFANNCL